MSVHHGTYSAPGATFAVGDYVMTPLGRCAFVEAIQSDGRVVLRYVERHQIRNGRPNVGPHVGGVALNPKLLQRLSAISGEPMNGKKR